MRGAKDTHAGMKKAMAMKAVRPLTSLAVVAVLLGGAWPGPGPLAQGLSRDPEPALTVQTAKDSAQWMAPYDALAPPPQRGAAAPDLAEAYGELPISFEANYGQADEQVRFLARGPGYTLFLTPGEAMLALRQPAPASSTADGVDMDSDNFVAPGPQSGFVVYVGGRWQAGYADQEEAERAYNAIRAADTIMDSDNFVAPGEDGGFVVYVGGKFLGAHPDQGEAERAYNSLIGAGPVLRMRLVGANPAPEMVGLKELPGTTSYFRGNDPARWVAGVPTYEEVRLLGVYPGVDQAWYGDREGMEHGFIVAPGADPTPIALAFEGADWMELDAAGELVLGVSGGGEVRLHHPELFQEVDGVRKELQGGYVLNDDGRVSFRLGDYDRSLPLAIYPVLVYSTFLGGSGGDIGQAIAVDKDGNAYVTGFTASLDFPTTAGALDRTPVGTGDVFVAKLNAAGTALVYSTFLGGSAFEEGRGIAVDAAGNAYVSGFTQSADFPTTPGAFDTALGGIEDAFVAKLNAAGTALVYSTFLGGSAERGTGVAVGFRGDAALGVAVDAAGNAYVAGLTGSTDFPTTSGAFDTTPSALPPDAFVTKLNVTGSALEYSTFLGERAGATAIAVDAAGNAYVTGNPGLRASFPTTPGALNVPGGGFFVTKLNPAGSAPVYSALLGGGTADTKGIALDAAGNAYVTGSTPSPFFATPGAFDTTLGGLADAFVAKLNPAGSALVYSTFLGGSGGADGTEQGLAIAVDAAGNAYVTGKTNSPDFPMAAALDKTLGGTFDAFVAKLNPAGTSLLYSTFLGGSGQEEGRGIAVDAAGNAYITGKTTSGGFPTTPGALDVTFGGLDDAFVAKIFDVLAPAAVLEVDNVGNRTITPADRVTTVRLAGPAIHEVPQSGITIQGDFGAAGLTLDLNGRSIRHVPSPAPAPVVPTTGVAILGKNIHVRNSSPTTASVVEGFDANFLFRAEGSSLLGGKLASGEFTILGGNSSGDGAALSIDRSANLSVDTVRMADLGAQGKGVDLKQSTGPGITIGNSHLEGNVVGVRVRTSQGVKLESNLIVGHTGNGVDTAEVKGAASSITGNTIENNARDGANIGAGSQNITLSGNTIRNNGGCGIRIAAGTTAITVGANTFAANAGGDVCGASAPPAPAAPQTTRTEIRVQAKVVTADFAHTDATGCIVTGITLFARRDTVLVPRPRVPTQLLGLDVSQRNVCTVQTLIAGTARTDNFNLNVPNDLQSASLQASVVFQNTATGQNMVFNIDLTWGGFGPVTVDVGVQRDRTLPGLDVRERFKQSLRSATATGILSDGTTNYAAAGSLFAEIRDVQSGTRTIIRSVIGDGICNGAETCSTAPADCGACPVP